MSGAIHDVPGNRIHNVRVGTIATNGAAEGLLFIAPFNCTYAVKALISGTAASDATNYATITVYNGGATGTATTSVGTLTNVATGGIVANTLTALTQTVTTAVTNDVLRFAVAQTSGGKALTNLALSVIYYPR
jgi:hypothetical protein